MLTTVIIGVYEDLFQRFPHPTNACLVTSYEMTVITNVCDAFPQWIAAITKNEYLGCTLTIVNHGVCVWDFNGGRARDAANTDISNNRKCLLSPTYLQLF